MYLYTVNNILSYNHNGMKNNGTFGLIDNLTLSYNGNQLAEVTEAASDYNATGTFEYKGANGSGYLKNHGVGSNDLFREQIFGKKRGLHRAGRSKIHLKK